MIELMILDPDARLPETEAELLGMLLFAQSECTITVEKASELWDKRNPQLPPGRFITENCPRCGNHGRAHIPHFLFVEWVGKELFEYALSLPGGGSSIHNLIMDKVSKEYSVGLKRAGAIEVTTYDSSDSIDLVPDGDGGFHLPP